jgi:hypothetical protein
MTALKKYKAVKELEKLLSFCLQYTYNRGKLQVTPLFWIAAAIFLFLKPLQIA